MDKRYKLNKLTNEQILQNCCHYFDVMAQNCEISPDETREFLVLFLEYILRYNKINSKDYDINIHLAKQLAEKSVEAYLHFHERNNQFDVYFLRDDMMFGKHNNRLYCRVKDKRLLSRMITDSDVLHHYIYKVTNSGHEFQHIVQIINNREIYEDYIKQKQEIYKNFKQSANRANFKILAKTAQENLDDIGFLHPMEIEANMLSYIYMLNLLRELLGVATDEKTKTLLHTMIMDVLADREDKYTEYKERDYSREHINAYANDISFEDKSDLKSVSGEDDEDCEKEDEEDANLSNYDD